MAYYADVECQRTINEAEFKNHHEKPATSTETLLAHLIQKLNLHMHDPTFSDQDLA